MKLNALNEDLADAMSKYTSAKGEGNLNKDNAEAGIAKSETTDEPEVGDRSGTQDSPVKPEHEEFLGTNRLGRRDKTTPNNAPPNPTV